MDADQFKTRLQELGLSYNAFSGICGSSPSKVKQVATGRDKMPSEWQKWLQGPVTMPENPVTIDEKSVTRADAVTKTVTTTQAVLDAEMQSRSPKDREWRNPDICPAKGYIWDESRGYWRARWGFEFPPGDPTEVMVDGYPRGFPQDSPLIRANYRSSKEVSK